MKRLHRNWLACQKYDSVHIYKLATLSIQCMRGVSEGSEDNKKSHKLQNGCDYILCGCRTSPF